MKSLFRCSTIESSKYITNISSLTRINKYKFSQQLQEEKFLEFSDLDDENTTINPLIQSLSENETFQTVAPDPNSYKRHPSIDRTEWKRKNRQRSDVIKGNHRFSGILDATSVNEVREQLELYKSRSLSQKRKTRKNNIMDILSSIGGDDVDSENVEESDKESDSDNHHDEKDMIDVRNAYIYAIKMCGYLKEFDEGFKLFQEAKQDKNVISPRIFGAAMWLIMEQEFNVDGLNKCYQLMDDMQNNYNLKATPFVYTELIKNATALRKHKRARFLVKRILSEPDEYINIYLKSRALTDAIINHYAKTKQIEKGLEFIQTLNNRLGSDVFHDITFAMMLNGVALAINDGDTSMIKVAEKLFEQSFKILDRAPNNTVFSTLLSCYVEIPDIESCVDILKSMLSNPDWPTPSEHIYTACLKCLTLYYKEPISSEKGWKYIEEILDLMEENKPNLSSAIYALLFNLCGGRFCNQSNLDKLYIFYDEMENKGIKPDPMTLFSLLLSGIDHYKFEIINNTDNKKEIEKDLMQYINWGILQFKKHNLNLTKQQNDRLQWKLSQII